MTDLLPCPLCKKLPGTKPAMARCITDGCEGGNLAAVTVSEWNTRAPLLASDAQGAVPCGDYVLVPRKPTEEMLSAGDSMMPQIAKGEDISTGYDALKEAWPAMLAASPAQSSWQPSNEEVVRQHIAWLFVYVQEIMLIRLTHTNAEAY